MKESEYDVVIVGARCAGATLATLLARAGARVILLDKDAMPSDHVLSTHSINPPGMDVLDEIGVGDAVRSVVPPSNVVRINVDGTTLDLRLPEHRATYCPRRKRLDGLLQQAAFEAGVEFQDRSRVVSLIHREQRICGVRAIFHDRERTLRAGLVVGADGRHSTVAKLVGAEEYLGYDSPRATFWGYWNAPEIWTTDSTYDFDVYMGLAGLDVRAIFQTDHGQLLLGSSPPVAQVDIWRTEPERALLAALNSDPLIAPLVRDSKSDGKVFGTIKERFLFRRAVGPGWALVGDAGHHKEYLLGDGITEALLQARTLASAINNGSDGTLEHWWRARDVAALPIYYVGQLVGALDRPAELTRVVLSRLAHDPVLMARILAVAERQLSPLETLPLTHVISWVTDAALHGRWRIIGETMGMARQALAVGHEMRARRDLLAAAQSPVRKAA